MELNAAERWLVNNPARALVQRFYEVPLLRRLGGTIESGRVLEVGCGRGVCLPLLLSQFGARHVDGVDLDPRQVARAQTRLRGKYEGRIDLRVASVEQLPFEDASFEAVFDFTASCTTFLLGRVLWPEIGRVLKPGGIFFFEEVTSAALERWSYRTFLKHPKENRFSEAEFTGGATEPRAAGLSQRSIGFCLAISSSALPGVADAARGCRGSVSPFISPGKRPRVRLPSSVTDFGHWRRRYYRIIRRKPNRLIRTRSPAARFRSS